MKKKLYIGCALTHLPVEKKRDFLDMLIKLKKELGEHFEILEFIGKNDVADLPPLDVYIHDIKNCVMKVDCMLALCDYPSLGLGYELATAIEKQGIPVLAMTHKNNFVSRLIRGINHPKFKFMTYDSASDIVAKTIEILNQ